jgi:hypothetical protein
LIIDSNLRDIKMKKILGSTTAAATLLAASLAAQAADLPQKAYAPPPFAVAMVYDWALTAATPRTALAGVASVPGWLLRRLMMGNNNNSFSVPAGAAAAANTISQNIDMVTLRVNYRFGGPVVARY